MLERKCDRCGRVIEDDCGSYHVKVTSPIGNPIGRKDVASVVVTEKDLCEHCVNQLIKFWENSPARRWTDEEVKQLFYLRHQGLTETQIVSKMDRTKAAIHGALYSKTYQERAEKLLRGDEQK